MSYKQELKISATPDKVFYAITKEVQSWWGNTNVGVEKEGDEFITRFDRTFWKFRISKIQPYKELIWDCIDAKHIHSGHTGIEKEWIGTQVVWNIKPIGKASLLTFEHNGLVPALNCYEICTPAWDKFVTQSLKAFLETGKGMPHLS